MVFRAFVFMVAFFFAANANASTISMFTPVSGVDPITGTGQLTTDGSGGFQVNALIPFTASQGVTSGFNFFFADTNPPFADNGFVQQEIGSPIPTALVPVLTVTSPLEVISEASGGTGPFTITALYDAIPFSQPAFEFILLEIQTSLFADPLTNAVSTDQAFVSITAVSPIPLPAGVWLMLAALGSLIALRRQRQA